MKGQTGRRNSIKIQTWRSHLILVSSIVKIVVIK